MRINKSWSVALFLLLAGIILSTDAAAKVSGNQVILEVDFQQPVISSSSYFPGYSHVEMKDLFSFGQVGEPVLPIKGVKLLIPPAKKVTGVEIVLGEKVTIEGTYQIEPGQRAYTIDQSDVDKKHKKELDQPKPEIYQAKAAYPVKKSQLVSNQRKTGYNISMIELHPVEYNPFSGTLSYYRKITIVANLEDTVTGSKGQRDPETQAFLRTKPEIKSKDMGIVEKLVDNKEDISLYNNYSYSLEAAPEAGLAQIPATMGMSFLFYPYVIITRADFAAAFQPLAQFKKGQGLDTFIVTTDWIYAHYDGTRPDGGTDNQTKLRNFIINAYNYWGTRYILLGGDSDSANVGGESEDPIVPLRYLTFRSPAPPYTCTNIPSDIYYSCLDGTFDYNQNGIYGEPHDGPNGQDVDLLAEIYIGRAPVDSVQEVTNFVNKTIAYEKADQTYYEDNYNVGEYLGGGGSAQYSSNMLEQIRLGSTDTYNTQGFLTDPSRSLPCLTLYDSPDFTWSTNQIINILNNGVHTINHFGHASPYGVMKLGNAEVDALTNTKYFIMYSQGCSTAAFDNLGGATDSVGEHFVTSPAGAVAFIGNAREGFYTENSTNGPSHFFHRQFWNAFFRQGIRELSRMNQDSKEDVLPYINYGVSRWCYYELNLLGDPTIKLNTQDPIPLIIYLTERSFIEASDGDKDGLFDPGEGFFYRIKLQVLNQNAYNVSTSLWSADPYVTTSLAPVNYGTILKGQISESVPLKIKISLDAPEFAKIPIKLGISANGFHIEKNFSIQIHGQRERLLTPDSSDQVNPDIAGNYVVWQDQRKSDGDIYLYDLALRSTQPVVIDPDSQCHPAVSDQYVIWREVHESFCHIKGYDINNKIEIYVPMYVHQFPQQLDISENQVVYADCLNGRWDINVSDLLKGTYRPITNDIAVQNNPKISGNYVVWQDNRNGNWDIFMTDLVSRTEWQITSDSGDQTEPAISGNYIVWTDTRYGAPHICLYNITTKQELMLTSYSSQIHPDIAGNYVVWQDYRNDNDDIYLYDIKANIGIIPLTTNRSLQCNPKISGKYVVWQDNRNDNWDIYSYYLGDLTPPIMPVVSDEGNYTASLFSLTAQWDSNDPESEIIEYQYQITAGSIMGTVIRDWTSTGTDNSVIASDLSLEHGKTYYFAVKARNEDRWSKTGYSNGITVDATAPSTPLVTDEGSYTSSITNLKANYSSIDPETGIAEYQYCIFIGTTTGIILQNWTSTGPTPSIDVAGLALSAGKTYYFGVKAKNGVDDVWSDVGYSDGIKVDVTPPSTPKVTDGGTFTTSLSQLKVSFSSADTQSGITEYQYMITVDTPTGTPIQNWISSGTTQSLTVIGLNLQNGKNYFFSVKAKNGAGVWSPIGYSNGITVDATPPTTPIVTDEGTSTTSLTTLVASWSSTDLESGIAQYQYRITRDSINGTVIRGWTSTGNITSVTATGLNLMAGKKYYFGVRARNNAGLWSLAGYSDGILITL